MQLTRYTDYSLRVMMYLAVHPDRLSTITKISQAYEISRNHLVKVVHELGGLGYIHTQRGKQGGIRLARAPGEINVGDVVRHVEKLDIVNCSQPQCPIVPACHLKYALDRAKDAFLRELDGFTLADLVANREEELAGLLDRSAG